MKKYLKAFILFPLLIQIIGTVALTFSNNDADQIQSSVLSVFIVATVPTFLITLWAAFHRYASYNVKAIALIAGLIGFSYTVVAGFFYATLVNDMGFGEWLRAGGLEITCLMAAGLALYSIMVLPLLFTERTPTIRRFEANIEPLNPPNLLMKLTALDCFLAKVRLNFGLKHPVPT